jgi:hypothetical protein
MSDSTRGRALVIASLVTIMALMVGLSALGGSASPAVRFGRPLIVVLACLLVWQRRLWARWLLVLPGLGILLAGPIAWGNNVPPWTRAGALFWAASLLYAGSLFLLFGSRDARAFLAPTSAPANAPSAGGGPGPSPDQTDKPRASSSGFPRLLRGEVPLPVAFWGWGVVGNVAVSILTDTLATVFLGGLVWLYVIYWIFSVIVIWRSAYRSAGNDLEAVLYDPWAILACIAVITIIPLVVIAGSCARYPE